MKDKVMVGMLSVVAVLAIPQLVNAYTGEELSNQTAIPLEKARSIALKAVPGEITDTELENEKGGSGLRYSFVISAKGVQHEVGVDALSGMILENKLEGPNPD